MNLPSRRAAAPAEAPAGALQQMLAFLARLEMHALRYRLAHDRADAVTVCVAAPGERWEVAFLADGGVEVETFVGVNGAASGAQAGAMLERLFSEGGSDA